MKDFKSWAHGAVVTIGNSISRTSIAKAMLALSISAIAINCGSLPIIMEKDPAVGKDGLTFSQLKGVLGQSSRVLSERYGTDTKVFVFNDDENLASIIQNFDSRFFEEYESDAIFTKLRSSVYSTIRDVTGLDISDADIGKQAFYRDMNSIEKSPFARNITLNEKGENGESLSVVFVKKDMPGIQSLGPTFESRYPYVISDADSKSYAFFHEMSHGHDDGVGKPSEKLMTLQRESIADVGYALINLRETGNMDAYINIVRPYRYSNAKDTEHMTVDIADYALSEVEEADVLGKSDVDLMKYAQELVNNASRMMFDNIYENREGKEFSEMAFVAHTHVLYALDNKSQFTKSFSTLSKITEGAAIETVMDFSREAMNSSLQNLVYNDAVVQYEGDFIDGVEKHIELWKDELAKQSLVKATASGDFNVDVFAEEMGFEIDKQSMHRRIANVATMDSYYQAATSVDFETQLAQANIKPQKGSVTVTKSSTPTLGR